MSRLPIIGITDCSRQYGPHAYHFSGDTHARAKAPVTWGPAAIRADLARPRWASVILDGADGTPITVTPFNIEPIHNSGPAIVRCRCARDSARPAWHVHLKENTIACR